MAVLDVELEEEVGVHGGLDAFGDHFLDERVRDGVHGLDERAGGRIRIEIADVLRTGRRTSPRPARSSLRG